MITHSDSIGKLAAALSTLQGALGAVGKDSSVTAGAYSYKYADLGAIWETIRGPLKEAGLAVIQAPMIEEAADVLVTTIAHESGEWARSVTRLPVKDKNDPKALGSSITYMRRYSLMSLLGIVTDDDDGNTAAGQQATYQRKGQAPRKTPPPAASDSDKRVKTGDADKVVALDTEPAVFKDEATDDRIAAADLKKIIAAMKPLRLSPDAAKAVMEFAVDREIPGGIISLTRDEGRQLAAWDSDKWANTADLIRSPVPEEEAA